MPVGTTEEAKSLAQRWMKDTGFFTREVVPCPNDLNFILEGKAPNEIPFLVIQPKKRGTAVVAIVNVKVTDTSYASLSSMEKDDRDKFLWNLQKEMMFAPPDFAFDPDFEKNGIPKGFQFSKEVYYDELTEGRLAEVVSYATRSAVWVILSFRRKFGPHAEVRQIE
jgi:hypothetical protein